MSIVRGIAALGAVIFSIAGLWASAQAETPASEETPSQDATALSESFWTEWNAAKSSPELAALTAAAGCGCTAKPGAGIPALTDEKPSVIDIAITRPEEAAKLLTDVASAPPVFRANLSTGIPGLPGIYLGDNAKGGESASPTSTPAYDPVSDAAVRSVVSMRASPEVLQAAGPFIAPKARARVEQFRANLTTGIPGLPGIYLGDSSGSARPSTPSGYTPVSGGSYGCPSR